MLVGSRNSGSLARGRLVVPVAEETYERARSTEGELDAKRASELHVHRTFTRRFKDFSHSIRNACDRLTALAAALSSNSDVRMRLANALTSAKNLLSSHFVAKKNRCIDTTNANIVRNELSKSKVAESYSCIKVRFHQVRKVLNIVGVSKIPIVSDTMRPFADSERLPPQRHTGLLS